MKKEKILRNPLLRIFIVVFSIAAAIAVFIILSILFYKVMFDENPHFILKNIHVKSSGYWNNRSDELASVLNLKKGSDNLYKLKPAFLKEELKRQKEYSIENVDVIKKLPDTLSFQIIERIPRALLYNRNSDLLVDENCVLINKKYCVNIDTDLPVITGFRIAGISFSQSMGKEKIPYGRVLFQLKPAIALISLTNINYPQFNIKLINLYNENELTVFLPGPINNQIIRVRLPFIYSKDVPLSNIEFGKGLQTLKKKLNELKKLFVYLRLKGQPVTEIDMLYKGQAVVR